MEFYLALVLLSFILLLQLRIGSGVGHRSAGRVAIYAFGVCIAAFLLDYCLRAASLNVADAALSSGVAPGWVGGSISRAYAFMVIYLPWPALLLCIFGGFEIFAFIWRTCHRRRDGVMKQTSTRLAQYGRANLITFLAAPAIAFCIAGSDGYRETQGRDATSTAYNLAPVLALYSAPAVWLGLRNAPTPAVSMLDFLQRAPPWIALSLLLAIVSVRRSSRLAAPPASVRQLLLGGAAESGLSWRARLKVLPWRGRYVLAGLALCGLCTAIAMMLSGLLYGFIALFYSGAIFLVPVILLVLAVCFMLGRQR